MANEFRVKNGLIVSGSSTLLGTLTVTSISASVGISGSITTATTASSAVSSSYALSASWAPMDVDATASYASTSSYAVTASFAVNMIPQVSASFATTSSAATSITFIPSSASYSVTSSAASSLTFIPLNATSASYAATASFITGSIDFPDGLIVTGSITASLGFSGSGASISGVVSSSYALSASWAPDVEPATSSYATTSSWSALALTASAATSITFIPSSASYALTSSHAASSSWAPNAFSSSYAVTASYALGGASPSNILYVDGKRTDAYSSDGSILTPYKTIASAISGAMSGVVTGIPANDNRYIIDISPSTYTEDIIMAEFVSLTGRDIEGTIIDGSVEWNEYHYDTNGNEIALLTVSTLNRPALDFGAHTDAYMGVRSCYITTTWDTDDTQDGIQDAIEVHSGNVEIYGQSYLEIVCTYTSQSAQILTLFHVENNDDYTNRPYLVSSENTHIIRTNHLNQDIHLVYGDQTQVESQVAISDGNCTIDLTETMTVNVAPGGAWVAGDLIIGTTSKTECTIVQQVDALHYIVKRRDGVFTLGEEIGTVTNKATQTGSYPVFSGPHINYISAFGIRNGWGEIQADNVAFDVMLTPDNACSFLMGASTNAVSASLVGVSYCNFVVDNLQSSSGYFGSSTGVNDQLRINYSKISTENAFAPGRYVLSGSAGISEVIGSNDNNLYVGGNVNASGVVIGLTSVGRGNISTISGSASVTGSNDSRFLYDFKAGSLIASGSDIHVVTSVVSDTLMTTTPWAFTHNNIGYLQLPGVAFDVYPNGIARLTGSLSVKGTVAATSLSGSGALIMGVVSSSYATSASYSATTNPVFTTGLTISGSLITTGSSNFIGIQTVTGSLFTSGNNTLVGNTILSGTISAVGDNNFIGSTTLSGSIFGSGSNLFFGNQTVTGSLQTSGSNTLVGNTILSGTISAVGDNNFIGVTTLSGSIEGSGSNIFFGNQTVTGSLRTSGSNYLMGNTVLSGTLLINGLFPPVDGTSSVEIVGNTDIAGVLRFKPISSNIDVAISASYLYMSGSTNDLYFTQNSDGLSSNVKLSWLENNIYTGLFNGGLISTQSATTYKIGSGSGIIVSMNATHASDPNPVVNYLVWGNLTGSIIPSTSYDQTYIGITPAGALTTQATPWTIIQYDTMLPIGIIIHTKRTNLEVVKSIPSVAYGWKQRSSVFTSAFGALKLSGYTLGTSGSGYITISGGTAFSDGYNFETDPNNPSYVTDPGMAISKIYRVRQSGSAWVFDYNSNLGYSTIDPSQYSNNGTLAGVANNRWSIQRIYWNPNSTRKGAFVYYGNALYSSLLEATANIDVETYQESPVTATRAVYIGALILQGNADFTKTNTFGYIPGGLFRNIGGSGGGGATTIQYLSTLGDVTITTPSQGQVLAYNAVTSKWVNSSSIAPATASYAYTASAATSITFIPSSASRADSASYAGYAVNTLSASYAPGSPTISGSYAQTASYAALAGTLLGLIESASYAKTASYAISAPDGAITASYAYTASIANTAYNLVGSITSASAANSSSYASYAVSASAANSITFVPATASAATSITFVPATASAATSITFVPATASAATSITFTPATASYAISASYGYSASSALVASSAASATSASYAIIASSANTVTSASYATAASSANTATSSSYATSASYGYSASSALVASSAASATSASYAISASYGYSASSALVASSAASATSASYAISASYGYSSSFAFGSTSSSFAYSASYALTAPGGATGVTGSFHILSQSVVGSTVNGMTITKVAGEPLVFGQLCYFHSAGGVMASHYSSSASAPAMAMCGTTNLPSGSPGLFLLHGVATSASWNWAVGTKLYMAASGSMTQSAVGLTDYVVQFVGIAHPNVTTVYFNPSMDFIQRT